MPKFSDVIHESSPNNNSQNEKKLANFLVQSYSINASARQLLICHNAYFPDSQTRTLNVCKSNLKLQIAFLRVKINFNYLIKYLKLKLATN